MIIVPFSILPPMFLKRISRIFLWAGERLAKKFPKIDLSLDQADFKVQGKEYLSMAITSTTFFFILFSILTTIVLLRLDVNVFMGIAIVFITSLFIFIQQLIYPRLKAKKKINNIEKNLLPALQNLLVQLSSGVPLFNSIAIISESDYGGISEQFRIAVRRINAGKPQIKVLESIARNNPSKHFRRTLWQIINGMKTGSDMSDVIKLSIDSLSEEQLIQIQRYGSQLNPLAMFYMLIAVIIPALGITFVILMASFLSLTKAATNLIFWGLLAVVFFFQLMFLGMLKTRRPNLL